MHTKTGRTLARSERVVQQRLAPAVYETVAPLQVESWVVGGEPVSPRVALGLESDASVTPDYTPFEVGSQWGAPWDTAWFRFSGTAPKDLADHEIVIDLGWTDEGVGFQCEGLIYRPDGTIVKALNPRNRWVKVAEVAQPGESFTFFVEAAANPRVLGDPLFAPTLYSERPETFDQSPIYTLRRADLAKRNVEVAELLLDLEILAGLARVLPEDSARYERILLAIERALNTYDGTDPNGSAKAARALLAPQLALPANASAHKTSAMGHAHIDSAWLWPVRETKRKVLRTVSNAISLLDEHDDFVYTMSSAVQFKWIEELDPELFGRLKKYIAEKRIIPVGGMWVEPDGMLPSGESFARQMLLGQKYFESRFGVRCNVMWMPDSFGYSGALPQISKLGGMDQFLTQKISWNDTNTFPHHSFWWEGIDGSRILTHFPPSDTYGAEVTPAELDRAAKNYKDKAISDHSILLFGYGDGGGGPTREMIGRAQRMADLEDASRVTQRTPDEFFDDLRAELEASDDYWTGELYLELHRGTFTTQSDTKRWNRRNEALLRQVEAAAVKRMLQGHPYPHAELEAAWETVLLGQFHDILPGTSINWVHTEAVREHLRVTQALNELDGIGEVLLPHRAHLPYEESKDLPSTVRPDGDGWVLENESLRAVFSADGLITSLVDKASGREVVPAGEALGKLAMYKDEPFVWDAWDIDKNHIHTEVIIDDIQGGKVFGYPPQNTVDVTRNWGNSSATISYRLEPGSRALVVQIDVHWHEDEKLLKLLFPLDVHTNSARFETQFGYLERAIHQNTSWDAARFEVCAHRWLQVAEHDFGVGIANDSSHGYSVGKTDGGAVLIGASLLKSPNFPDQKADRGVHNKRFAIVPSADVADVIDIAEELNEVAHDFVGQLVTVDDPSRSVRISAVKAAEDGSGDVIVRVYESLGGRATATLRLDELFGEFKVRVVNMLEDEVDAPAPSVSGRDITLNVLPFQVLSLRLAVAGKL